MKTNNNEILYVSPKVETLETLSQSVFCASGDITGHLDDMSETNGSWN